MASRRNHAYPARSEGGCLPNMFALIFLLAFLFLVLYVVPALAPDPANLPAYQRQAR